MSRKQIKLISSIIAFLIIVAVTYANQQQEVKKAVVTYQPGLYTVTHFTDGDTITIDMNGKDEKIRFIGVDTPETHKPNTPVQCFGPQAAARTKQLLTNQKIRLVSDSLTTNRDRYDRLLRYVYLTDGTNINKKLIEEGYGFYYPYFPFTKSKEFNIAEQNAIGKRAGLWAVCRPTPTDGGGYISNPAT